MGVSLIGLIVVGVLGIGAVWISVTLIRAFFGGSRDAGGGLSMGHATLTCPHCQQETQAGHPTCDRCGRDL